MYPIVLITTLITSNINASFVNWLFRRMEEATIVIIGGGIAGVSCAEGLTFLCPNETIVLITPSPLIKAVTNLIPLTKMLAQFSVEEISADSFSSNHPSLRIIHDSVVGLDSTQHTVRTSTGHIFHYKKLCICSGGTPKIIKSNNSLIVGIRDTESVRDFQSRVKNARRIVILGNGGIATELVHELSGVEIVWVIKDKHISAPFIDPGAAEFFQHSLSKLNDNSNETPPQTVVKRLKYTVSDVNCGKSGAALGPDWHSKFDLTGSLQTESKVTVEYNCEVKAVLTPDGASALVSESDRNHWPVFVELTNGSIHSCDFIVSATGVEPNSQFSCDDGKLLELSSDKGVKVNWKMESNLVDVYAAGDVCCTTWECAPHWFQMRLWTQARQMGMYAAKTMVASLDGKEPMQDFCFELFTHVTQFFGYKVVLLGLYNGQTLGSDQELLLRVTPRVEYIKLVMRNGRMQGAVLIGETGLEEMCENLILNQLDLSFIGVDILNPGVDIEDYFD